LHVQSLLTSLLITHQNITIHDAYPLSVQPYFTAGTASQLVRVPVPLQFHKWRWMTSTTYVTHTLHKNSILTAIFPGEPGLAGCSLLHLFLDCSSFWDRPKLSMSFLTQSRRMFYNVCQQNNKTINKIQAIN